MKKDFRIEGMSCTSCAMQIEEVVSAIGGVSSASVSYEASEMHVDFEINVVSEEVITAAIAERGYKAIPINESDDSLEADNKSSIKTKILKSLGLVVIAVALYFILTNTAVFNFVPEVSESMGYGLLFIVGLLTSVHCIAMCGGINLSQCVAYRSDSDTSVASKLKPSLLYNTGRVISYTLIGGIVGALGSVVSFSGTARGIVVLVAGAFMITMGLNMINIFPWLRKIVPRMPKRLSSKIISARAGRGPLVVGLFNGFMPCGPLQTMQLYALGTGSFLAGAFSMFMFSIGTVPLMFGLGALSTFLTGKFTKKLMKVSAVVVIVLGVIMLGRGLNQAGVSTAIAAEQPGNIAAVQEEVQLVSTDMKAGEYEPIMVQSGVPVRWTINAEESELNGCNNPVTIPKYGIEKRLVPGENIIEFTPTNEGDIVYTCWMGMISGNIRVVADIAQVNGDEIEQITDREPLYQLDTVGEVCGTIGLDSESCTAVQDAELDAASDAAVAIGVIQNGVQRVSIDVDGYVFSSSLVILQRGVSTEWFINGKSLNSCNQTLIFPTYQARLDLQEGENLIEFIPHESFSFSCWMGMINGYVAVVDDIKNYDLETIILEAEGAAEASSGGCCG